MYVEIRNGKANQIVIDPDKVGKLRQHGLVIIDCTDIEPKPQNGWLYDAETDTFSKPLPMPEPEPEPIELLDQKINKLLIVLKNKKIITDDDIKN